MLFQNPCSRYSTLWCGWESCGRAMWGGWKNKKIHTRRPTSTNCGKAMRYRMRTITSIFSEYWLWQLGLRIVRLSEWLYPWLGCYVTIGLGSIFCWDITSALKIFQKKSPCRWSWHLSSYPSSIFVGCFNSHTKCLILKICSVSSLSSCSME